MKFHAKPVPEHNKESSLQTTTIPLDLFPFQADDDPKLWRAVVDYVLKTWEPELGAFLEIGCCSHWLRPHQTRWLADGGFAAPFGYGNGFPSWSFRGLPQLDWSFRMTWTEQGWKYPGDSKLRGSCPDIRIAIPSRTCRHEQAAIHSRWRVRGEFATVLFGFRNKPEEGWICTADSSLSRAKKKGRGRKPRTHRQKADFGRYRREQANDCAYVVEPCD